MNHPFENDPFAIVAEAFSNLYQGINYTAFWDSQIRDDENGATCYGLTDFGEDGTVFVFVRSDISVENAVEILAHELAHVAVGIDHDHDEEWGAAFDAIFDEYNRIGNERYGHAEEKD